jgi:hypothetical protein
VDELQRMVAEMLGKEWAMEGDWGEFGVLNLEGLLPALGIGTPTTPSNIANTNNANSNNASSTSGGPGNNASSTSSTNGNHGSTATEGGTTPKTSGGPVWAMSRKYFRISLRVVGPFMTICILLWTFLAEFIEPATGVRGFLPVRE